MEDFIKFIPFILYGLYKLFGSGKEKQQTPKRANKPAKRSTPNQSTTSLEDILRELTGETQPTEVPQAKSIEAKKPANVNKRQREKLDIVDHQYDFVPEYEHHADTGPTIDVIRQEIDDARGVHDLDILENFDLRQAVIAQTILTRPEY